PALREMTTPRCARRASRRNLRSEADGALETAAVGEHVHVRKYVVGMLVLGTLGDLRQAFDGGVFIPRLVARGPRQAVVGAAPLRYAVLQRITRGQAVGLFRELVGLFRIPRGADLEHDGGEATLHDRQEVTQRAS